MGILVLAYCTASDVRLLVHTSLSDSDIESLIALADAELDSMLGGASMSTTQKKNCSMRLTAVMIVASQPRREKVGDLVFEYADRVGEWRRYVRRQVARAVGRWHVVDALED